MKIKILNSNTNRPLVTNLTKVHDIYYMPKCKRRFTTKEDYFKYISNAKTKDLIKSPNDIRYLEEDIKLKLAIYLDRYYFEIEYTIEKGLIYDGGSLPLKLQSLVLRASKLGYCVHDNEYKFKQLYLLVFKYLKDQYHPLYMEFESNSLYYSQLIADNMMTSLHEYRKVNFIRRFITYSSLRLFGKYAFISHRKCDNKEMS